MKDNEGKYNFKRLNELLLFVLKVRSDFKIAFVSEKTLGEPAWPLGQNYSAFKKNADWVFFEFVAVLTPSQTHESYY